MDTEAAAPSVAAYIPPNKTLKERLRGWWLDLKDRRRTPITEKNDRATIDSWYVEARNIKTPRELDRFVRKLRDRYQHDYGTICHAVTAAAVAAAWCINAEPRQGGITGFQSGAIFWEFARQWRGISGDARLLAFDDMLYPQCAEKFDKVIALDTFERLREKAKNLLADNNVGHGLHPEVRAHMQSIADGTVPFGYRVNVKEA
jgi:hypothetical protein